MIRLITLLAALGFVASCAQYQEPNANCFSFLAAVAPVEPNCVFTPIAVPEGDVEV